MSRKDNQNCQIVGMLDIKGRDQLRRVYSVDDIAPTLLTCQGGQQEVKIFDTKRLRVRKLTPKEYGILQAFPMDDWKQVVSDTQAYKQFGNAVTTTVFTAIAEEIAESIYEAEQAGAAAPEQATHEKIGAAADRESRTAHNATGTQITISDYLESLNERTMKEQCMTLEDVLKRMKNAELIRILDGEEEIYVGFAGCFEYKADYENYLKAKVEKLGTTLEIKHEAYKEKGLMPPMHPEQTPNYLFSDLQTTLYFDITLESEE